MAITFAREKYEDIIEELRPLFDRHWAEIAGNKDIIPLAPDYAIYAKSEELGMLRAFIARNDGQIVGYAVYFVREHLHYKTTLEAISDVIWLAPAFRKGLQGVRLMKFAEAKMAEEGVVRLHTMTKIAHPALGKVLEYLGHKPIEVHYSKVLKGA